MAKKKEKLILEGKMQVPIVPEWEQPYKVPQNWIVCYGEIFGFVKGKKPQNLYKEFHKNRIPYVNIKYFETGIIEQYTDAMSTNRICNENDILIVWDGARAGLVGTGVSGAVGSTLCKIDCKDLNKKYVYYFFQYIFKDINKNTRGTGIPHVDPGFLASTKFPFPPLYEQRRIVASIESLFEKLDHAKELVQSVLNSFETYRATILHKAFAGEFTTKWRNEHPGVKNLTLEKIGNYAKKLPEKYKKQIGEAQKNTTKMERENGHIWYLTTLGAISVVTNGSTPSRKYTEYWNGNIPWVSSGEVCNNIISTTKESISQEGYNASSVKLLPVGTVLIAMIGDGKTRGQSAILDIEATINQNIAAINIDHKFIVPKFIWYWLQKEYHKNREIGGGSGPKALNCKHVRELEIIVPSLPEQREIVRILDRLFEKEQKAKKLANVIEKIDIMKEIILARAFRGKLSTNDPAEESAMELLKKITLDTMNNLHMQKTKNIRMKVDIMPLSIMEILNKYNRLTPEQLKKETQLDIDEFYEQVKKFVDEGLIMEVRENGESYLEAVKNANK